MWYGLPWYQLRPNRDRLEIWIRAKAPGRIGAITFTDAIPAGDFDPHTRAVRVNPTSVGANEQEQWRGTRAILVHEAGHANYTGDLGDGLVGRVANILEDQRVEWLMWNSDPTVFGDLQFKNWWRYHHAETMLPGDAPEAVLQAALLYRWEWWIEEKERTKIRLSPVNAQRWEQVRPLVEQAWLAKSTGEVVAIASRILDLLGLKETDGVNVIGLDTEGMSRGTSDPICSAPVSDQPPQHTQQGGPQLVVSLGACSGELKADEHPQPYIGLVDQAMPYARQLAARLERPTPNTRDIPDGQRGRYCLRYDLRDPEHPFKARLASKPAPGMAVEIIGDRSMSMSEFDKLHNARLAAMIIHLACEMRGIPHAITLFDGRFSVLDYGGNTEIAKALIAGWGAHTWTGEMAFTIRHRLPSLLRRREGTKVMFVIHDGAPDCYDSELARMREIHKQCAGKVYIIGIYIGDTKTKHGKQTLSQMQGLFERLVAVPPAQLAEKLADIIATLG